MSPNFTIFKVVFVLLIVGLFSFKAQCIVINVAGSGTDVTGCTTCQSIAFAISEANPGDTIQVAAGTYNEFLVIDKSIVLLGAFAGTDGNDFVRGTNESILQPSLPNTSGFLIDVQADNVVIDGFTLDGGGIYVQGVHIDGFDNIDVINNRIESFADNAVSIVTQIQPAGIFATASATGNNFNRNRFSTINNFFDPILYGVAIRIEKNHYANIQNNTLAGSTPLGIEIIDFDLPGMDVLVSNNILTPLFQGIVVSDIEGTASEFQISNNDITLFSKSYAVLIYNVPTLGIGFSKITEPIQVNNNNINGSYYGYVCYDLNIPAPNTFTIHGGDISGVMQGVDVLNVETDLAGTISAFANSTLIVDGVTMSAFNGDPMINASINFHAGIYVFTTGTFFITPETSINITVRNCDISDVGSISSNSAGIYATNSAIGYNNLISLTVEDTRITNNENRGVFLNRVLNATFDRCTINDNGFNGVSADGVGVILSNGNNTIFRNCYIQNPNSATNLRFQVDGSHTFTNCALGQGTSFQIENNGGGIIQASDCWWGSSTSPDAAHGGLVPNQVDYTPWFNSDTDTDLATEGFQGDYSYLRVSNNFQSPSGQGRIQEAHDKLIEGGTVQVFSSVYIESTVISKNMTLTSDINNTTINNLTMNGAGKRLLLGRSFNIDNTLTLVDGVIDTDVNILRITSDAVGAVLRLGNAWVAGFLSREVLGANTYEFPIGSDSVMERMEITFADPVLTFARITARYILEEPLNHPSASALRGPPADSVTYSNLLFGYWEIQPNASESDNFNLNLYPSVLGSASARIVRRDGTGVAPLEWFGDVGTSVPVSGGVGISDLSDLSQTQFNHYGVAVFDEPLSVNITKLEAFNQGLSVEIQWTSTEEIDILSYEVERSLDGLLFEKIAVENATGFLGENDYVVLDREVIKFTEKLIYYRLRIVETTGKVSYSNLVSVIREIEAEEIFTNIYPNPVVENLHVDVIAGGSLLLHLYSLRGDSILRTNVISGKNTLDLSKLPAGIYLLEISSRHKRIVKKVVKL